MWCPRSTEKASAMLCECQLGENMRLERKLPAQSHRNKVAKVPRNC